MKDTPMTEKLDLRSADIAEDKRQELLRLFPEIRTEGGKLDFARLKLALGETMDVGMERRQGGPPFKTKLAAFRLPEMLLVLDNGVSGRWK